MLIGGAAIIMTGTVRSRYGVHTGEGSTVSTRAVIVRVLLNGSAMHVIRCT